MPYDRQFGASPRDVLQALEHSVRRLEKFRSANTSMRTIDFNTKSSGWSWGSSWKIEVQPHGAGSVAIASIISAGSAVAETSEGKKIRQIFDAAEHLLTQTVSQTKVHSTPVVLQPAVEPNFSRKHEHLVAPILQALADAEAAARVGDVVTEELSIGRAERTASSGGMLAIRPRAWCAEEVQKRIEAGRLRLKVELIAKVGANMLIMSDRVLQNGTVCPMDHLVEASVEVGGQVLQSTRPTMTRMAVGSVLPGSALLVGLAAPKTKTTDMRTASFILVHPKWRLVEPIDPDGAHEVSGIAAQINAAAAQGRASTQQPQPQGSPSSIADELTKLATLRDSGILTNEEFAVAKARLLA